MSSRLELVPMCRDEANAFIAAHHRHHKPVRVARFCIGAARNDEVVAVAIVGNPKARMAQDGYTAEVVRLCSVDPQQTNGHASGASSFLYAACWRAARAMGFLKLITYTLPEEGGASLRGAGWKCIGEAGGGPWDRKKRPRVDTHPLQEKMRWEAA
jgi:hypothetical protein